jgi:hypothetical protein
LGSALDQEHRELAEQIRIDDTYIGEQSGDFKLPDAAMGVRPRPGRIIVLLGNL